MVGTGVRIMSFCVGKAFNMGTSVMVLPLLNIMNPATKKNIKWQFDSVVYKLVRKFLGI